MSVQPRPASSIAARTTADGEEPPNAVELLRALRIGTTPSFW